MADVPSARDVALWNSVRHWVMDLPHIHGTPAYDAAIALREWALDLGLPLTPHTPGHAVRISAQAAGGGTGAPLPQAGVVSGGGGGLGGDEKRWAVGDL